MAAPVSYSPWQHGTAPYGNAAVKAAMHGAAPCDGMCTLHVHPLPPRAEAATHVQAHEEVTLAAACALAGPDAGSMPVARPLAHQAAQVTAR